MLRTLFANVSLDIDYTKEKIGEIKIQYFLCNECGTVFQAEIPSDNALARYYSTCPAHVDDSTPPVTKEFFVKRFSKLMSVCGFNGRSDVRVLEVGCASGEFASQFVEKGISVFGVEPGEQSSAVAASRGIHILGKSISDIDTHDTFDLVFSMGTFEHLPAPRDTLKLMVELAKENGYIYIDVPDNRFIDRERS